MKTTLSTLVVLLLSAFSLQAQSTNIAATSISNIQVQKQSHSTGLQQASTASLCDSSYTIIACDFGFARRNRIRELRAVTIIKSNSTDTTTPYCPTTAFIQCKINAPILKTGN